MFRLQRARWKADLKLLNLTTTDSNNVERSGWCFSSAVLHGNYFVLLGASRATSLFKPTFVEWFVSLCSNPCFSRFPSPPWGTRHKMTYLYWRWHQTANKNLIQYLFTLNGLIYTCKHMPSQSWPFSSVSPSRYPSELFVRDTLDISIVIVCIVLGWFD